MSEMDFRLGETAEMIRDTTGRFARERVAPMASEIDREDRFPVELWPANGRARPAWHHGGGSRWRARARLSRPCRRLRGNQSRIGLGRPVLRRPFQPCINQIARWGSPAQKAKYLPGLISGDHVGSLAMSEAGAGSDVVSMRLRADRVEGGFRLNGTKFLDHQRPYARPLSSMPRRRRWPDRRASQPFSSKRISSASRSARGSTKLGMRGSPPPNSCLWTVSCRRTTSWVR